MQIESVLRELISSGLVPLACIIVIFISGLYLLHIISISYAKFHLHRKPVASKDFASVSIIKPLVGAEENLFLNLESFFKLNYPQYELLFCVYDSNDSAIQIVDALMRKHPRVDAQIFVGGENIGMNRKISNMMPAYRASKYPLILISDSAIYMREDALVDMTVMMKDDVGLVTQLPFCMDRCSFGANLEQVYFGTGHARIYLASNCLQVVCACGMSSLMRKCALEEVGGFENFSNVLAEDHFIAFALKKRGWKIALSSLPTLQNSGFCDVNHFHSRMRRWMKLRFAMLPFTIILDPLQECFAAGLLGCCAIIILCPGYSMFALYFAVFHLLFWLFCDYCLIHTLQNGPLPFSFSQFLFIWLYREGSAFPTWCKALINPTITWKNAVFRLRWGGEIRVPLQSHQSKLFV